MQQKLAIVGKGEEMGIIRVLTRLCGHFFFSLVVLAGRIWMKKGIWWITQHKWLRKVTGSARLLSETGQQNYWHMAMNKKSFFMWGISKSSAESRQ